MQDDFIIKMKQRPWTKSKKVNFRIEVEARGYRHLDRSYIGVEAKLEQICRDLNDFFSSHKDCAFEAFVNADEIEVCQFCGEPYEEVFEPGIYIEFNGVCANCGKGSKEAMIEQLKSNTPSKNMI